MSASQSAIDALVEVAASDGGGAPPAAATTQPASGASSRSTVARRSNRAPTSADIERILHISVPVSVTVAEQEMSIESIVAMTIGSIVEFDVPFDAGLTLRAGDRPIGEGQAIKVGEKFGLRITAINTVHQRIDAMGGH